MTHLDKFEPDQLTVAKFGHWIVTVRAKQVTPGDLVVLPVTPYEHFDEVDASAATELFKVLGKIERVALGPFHADRVNVVAAMMKDPFIHFHFFPRFERPVEVFGREWSDEDWPRAITLRDVETPGAILQATKAFYAEHLGDGRD